MDPVKRLKKSNPIEPAEFAASGNWKRSQRSGGGFKNCWRNGTYSLVRSNHVIWIPHTNLELDFHIL